MLTWLPKQGCWAVLRNMPCWFLPTDRVLVSPTRAQLSVLEGVFTPTLEYSIITSMETRLHPLISQAVVLRPSTSNIFDESFIPWCCLSGWSLCEPWGGCRHLHHDSALVGVPQVLANPVPADQLQTWHKAADTGTGTTEGAIHGSCAAEPTTEGGAGPGGTGDESCLVLWQVALGDAVYSSFKRCWLLCQGVPVHMQV